MQGWYFHIIHHKGLDLHCEGWFYISLPSLLCPSPILSFSSFIPSLPLTPPPFLPFVLPFQSNKNRKSSQTQKTSHFPKNNNLINFLSFICHFLFFRLSLNKRPILMKCGSIFIKSLKSYFLCHQLLSCL